MAFVGSLPEPAAEAERRQAARMATGGVVIFTGEGARLSSGMAVFSDGAGERLLISGVNADLSRAEIAAFWPGDGDRFECCVDLGHAARSTSGNAYELKEWVEAHGFARVLLVTSEYHMPRALIETRRRLPGVDIAAYPVASGRLGGDGRPRNFRDWRAMSDEFAKFLAVRLTAAF